MATLYEVEHNVQFVEAKRTRRVDMASFFSLLNQISESPSPSLGGDSTGNHPGTGTGTARSTPHNPHATPTPVDTAALFRLLQDQLQTLYVSSPSAENRGFLESLISSLEDDVNDPPTRLRGVSQEFLDAMDRVDRKKLRAGDDCAICKVPYLEDEYCLVVEVPCAGRHRFDLECVGPWLRSKGTCPMCRAEVGQKKGVVVPVRREAGDDDDDDDDEEEEEEDGDMMYA